MAHHAYTVGLSLLIPEGCRYDSVVGVLVRALDEAGIECSRVSIAREPEED